MQHFQHPIPAFANLKEILMILSSFSHCEPLQVQHVATSTVISTIVQWPHQRGGEGHCLARAYCNPTNGSAIILLSELRSNPRTTAMGADFGDVANALSPCLKQAGLAIEKMAHTHWIAHYGQFSSWEAIAEDTFLQLFLVWDGRKFKDLREEQQLSQQEVLAFLNSLSIPELESVYHTLASLRWTKHNG